MGKKHEITNVKDLRNDLIGIYGELKSGKAELSTVRTQSDIAGKIMKSVALELAEKVRTKDNTPIPFLNADFQG